MANPSEWRIARPKVAAARNLLWRRFRDDPNVVGIGFGAPSRNGRRLDVPVCVVFVVRKLPAAELAPGQLVPPWVDVEGTRVETDVVESGRFYAHEYTSRMRPALPGISIGHGDITAGTLGCIVTDPDNDGRLSILSNNHVLANSNAAEVGDKIYQPGPADAPQREDRDVVGMLTRWVPIRFDGTPNVVDCAVADVSADCDVYDEVMQGGRMAGPSPQQPAVGLLFAGSGQFTLLNPINEVAARLRVEMTAGAEARSPIREADAEPPGAPVQKTGRSSEYTTGRILDIDVIADVNYGGGQVATFGGLIVTTPIACGGDSGSVVCRGGSGNVVAPGCLQLCPVMKSAEELTGVPFTQEWVSIKYCRDKFLSTTLIGRWLLDSVLTNQRQQEYVLRGKQINVPPEDRAFSQALYAQYGSELKLILYNPDRDDLRIREHHLADAEEALTRLRKFMREDESRALDRVMTIGWGMVGLKGRQVIAQLNDQVLYQELREIFAGVQGLTDPHD